MVHVKPIAVETLFQTDIINVVEISALSCKFASPLSPLAKCELVWLKCTGIYVSTGLANTLHLSVCLRQPISSTLKMDTCITIFIAWQIEKVQMTDEEYWRQANAFTPFCRWFIASFVCRHTNCLLLISTNEGNALFVHVRNVPTNVRFQYAREGVMRCAFVIWAQPRFPNKKHN